MANQLFPKGREGFLAGEIDWDTATIKVALVDGYTFDATDKFMSDVLGTIVATSPALTAKTVIDGVADAADVTFTAVPTGPAVEHLIVFQSSAVTGGADVANTAQRVIASIDTGTGLPVTPNGGDITIAWSNTAGTLIFKL